MPTDIEVILTIDTKLIENFNRDSQEDENWGNINSPFDANNLTVNSGTNPGSWFQELSAEQVMKFKLDNESVNHGLEIEYIRLNPLGTIDYVKQSPLEAWGEIVDLDDTKGAIGEFGSFYLTPVWHKDNHDEPAHYKLKASKDLKDNSPNLSYSILFSFVSDKNHRHYCTIDPLIKTSSVHTPPKE